MNKLNTVRIGKNDTIKKVGIWLLLSGFFAVFYYQTVLWSSLEWVPNWFGGIVNGDVASPYNYRLLVPYLFTHFDLMSPLKSTHDFFICTFVVFLFSTAILMQAISFTTSDRSSIVALLFSSFFILLTFPMGGVQIWSYVDIGLYSLAYIAMIKMWNAPSYVVLVSIALLNRETGILLSVIPLIHGLLSNKFDLSFSRYKKEVFIMVYGVVFFFLIRVFQGTAEHVITAEEVFLRNFSPQILIINIFVYAGAFLWLLIGNSVKLNLTEKVFFGILLINIILIFFFGLFREIRMFVPYVFLFGLIFARRTD